MATEMRVKATFLTGVGTGENSGTSVASSAAGRGASVMSLTAPSVMTLYALGWA